MTTRHFNILIEPCHPYTHTILAIPVNRHMGPDETREALLADLQACDRAFTQADWDAADDAVRTFCEGLKPKPFLDVEDREQDDEPCYLFVYIEPIKPEEEHDTAHT
jgi:hypothetical protein